MSSGRGTGAWTSAAATSSRLYGHVIDEINEYHILTHCIWDGWEYLASWWLRQIAVNIQHDGDRHLSPTGQFEKRQIRLHHSKVGVLVLFESVELADLEPFACQQLCNTTSTLRSILNSQTSCWPSPFWQISRISICPSSTARISLSFMLWSIQWLWIQDGATQSEITLNKILQIPGVILFSLWWSRGMSLLLVKVWLSSHSGQASVQPVHVQPQRMVYMT